MAYKHQTTTYLEKELMFKNNNKTENKIGNCKLSLASPSQISLEVTENGKVHYNYIQSVTTGKFDNMLCVTSQNGTTFFFFESREDRDEWYSTIKQLQSGHVPSYPRKRESLPARPPDTHPKPRGRQKMSASSPSTLQEIFKKELETAMSPNLKKPQMKKGSGSYINMDYNQALQHSKESYNLLNVLHGIQNVQVDATQSGASEATEDELYDMPEGSSTNPIEERIYEELDDFSDGSDFGDAREDQIYDAPCDAENENDQFYDDTEFEAGARAGTAARASGWDSRQQTDWLPPLPPRPSHILSPELQQPYGERDDLYEPPTSDLPPPLPPRPPSSTPNVPDQVTGATRNGNKALQPPQIQPKSRRMSEPSTKAPFKTDEMIPGRSRTYSTSDHSLADELAKKITQRGRSSTMSQVSSSQDSNHTNTVPKVPDKPHVQTHVWKSSDVDKVRHRSHDQQSSQTRPNSGLGVTDELAMKLAQRSSVLLTSESTGSGSDRQTQHGQACNSHRDHRGHGPSNEQQGESTTAPWKQKQDHGNHLPKAQLIPKKKAVVPPPTLAKHGKTQSSASLGHNTKQPPNPPPKPPPKPTQPSPSDGIYDDNEVRPLPAVKPKPKITKPGTTVRGEELDVRIPRQAMQSSLAGSVSFSDNSDFVMIDRTDLPDYLQVGDQVLQIGDIDVRNSSSAFVAECWKRVSETHVRVKVLRR